MIILMFARNIYGGYTLLCRSTSILFWDLPSKNMYYPFKPKYFYIKVGYEGVYFHGHIFLMYDSSIYFRCLCLFSAGGCTVVVAMAIAGSGHTET